MSIPLRAFSSPPHRRTGAPGRAPGHRGPDFSEELKSKRRRAKAKAKSRTLRLFARCFFALVVAVAVAFDLAPSPSAHRMCAAFPGSLLQRRAGGGKARRVADRDVGQFGVRAGCPVDKPRRPAAHFAGMDARKARKRGAFSFGYFSLGKQRKVTRPPKEDETLWL